MSLCIRLVVKALFALSIMLPSGIASGVTSNLVIADEPEAISHVTTGAADRARTDVQIRRIKNLIITQNDDGDRVFEQLEKLQQKFHGTR
mgnify:CR=1 FL=1